MQFYTALKVMPEGLLFKVVIDPCFQKQRVILNASFVQVLNQKGCKSLVFSKSAEGLHSEINSKSEKGKWF